MHESSSLLFIFLGSFFTPALLHVDLQMKMHEWVGVSKPLIVIYKASRDGFGVGDFHNMCDGKGENLGVIESSNGYLFGWWTQLSWMSRHANITDESASSFIFTLRNPACLPARYNIKDIYHAIRHHPNCGPNSGMS